MFLLVPSPLSQKTPKLPVLAADLPTIQCCTTWIVENAKPARAALNIFSMSTPIRELKIHEIKDLTPEEIKNFIQKSKQGELIGVMSDAGCPGIADPGAHIVAQAHQAGCAVRPLVGPSSILLALMGSGLNGQRFTFHGYPPVETRERDAWIKQTEHASKQAKCTQISIETPFRNEKLIEALTKTLEEKTRLCVAWDLTGDEECIQTKSIAQWRKNPPKPSKFPCLFLWLGE